MLKDNHIGAAGSVEKAIQMAKEYAPFVRKIEVEVESLDMVRQAVAAGADIIMLDNMDHDVMKEAIEIIDGRAEIEVSGNVTKENISKLVDLGVDYISSGALTHSAPILDLSLKNLHVVILGVGIIGLIALKGLFFIRKSIFLFIYSNNNGC